MGRGGGSAGPVCGTEFEDSIIVECLRVSLALEDSPGAGPGGELSHTSEEFTFNALSGG